MRTELGGKDQGWIIYVFSYKKELGFCYTIRAPPGLPFKSLLHAELAMNVVAYSGQKGRPGAE